MVFWSVITVPELATGKTYVFKYEALVMGGLPEEGLARAGVKVLSKVMISALSANTFILKVTTNSMLKNNFIIMYNVCTRRMIFQSNAHNVFKLSLSFTA